MTTVVHKRTTVHELVQMSVTMQPRLVLREDTSPYTPKLNECVHCGNDGKHVASNWAVTYATLEVVPNKAGQPVLEVRPRGAHEEVCDSHLPDVMENIRDYYNAELYAYETATSVQEVIDELNARPNWK